MSRKNLPGYRWRVLAHLPTHPVRVENAGCFDELVVDDWLHVEQMDTREWWAKIGPHTFGISISRTGDVRVVHLGDLPQRMARPRKGTA